MIQGSAPAMWVYKAALKYAIARGLPFFTEKDRDIVLRLYAAHAKINN